MNEQFNFLFHYLKKENITIDKTEFLFQLNSHPDYPSLLAIADTLTFFKIDNAAFRIDFSEIEMLPDGFLTILNKTQSKPELCYLEKNKENFFYTIEKKKTEISKSELEKNWNGVVLLAEKISEIENTTNKNKFAFVLPILCIISTFLLIAKTEESLASKFFILFPILGILFSIASLKDLFNTKSELISSFCNLSVSSSCEAVINSDKWKLFKFLNFSSLSIIFFSSQFLLLFLFLFIKNASDFFSIQKVLLLGALPLIVLSIYFQKFVEKKWCPICLVLISILLFEIGYISYFFDYSITSFFTPVLTHVTLFSLVALVWISLKATLTKQKELKEFQLTGNRFIRNYDFFKNNLTANEKINLPSTPIILGNKNSNTEITIITSPFCGYCKDADVLINNILKINGKNSKINVLINVDFERESEEKKQFLRSLVAIYFEKGENEFSKALTNWFENKDLTNWLKLYKIESNNEKSIDELLNAQHDWCINSKFTFTPAFFVNGYEYPKMYERKNLGYYINEAVEDDTL